MIIQWTEPALSDLHAIHNFIARDSNTYADITISDILDEVQQLEQFPMSGRIVPEIHDETIRELIEGNYRIIYNITKSEVIILTILHGARDFRELP